MATELRNANIYFDTRVLDNSVWVNTDNLMKNRVLANAKRMLERNYHGVTITDEALFEQALWLLKLAEVRRHAEQGVISFTIDGISVQLSHVDKTFSPAVISILGRPVGRSLSDRRGYIAKEDDNNIKRGVNFGK